MKAPMARPLVLVPSSKAKADGGDGPAYRRSSALTAGPLAKARRHVLSALKQAAAQADDRAVARLCGVKPADVAEHRRRLRALGDAPTMPAHLRYTGVVHRFARMETVSPATAGVDVATFSALTGIAMLDEPVPSYRLEVTGRVPELGVLRTWWRTQLGEHLRTLGTGRVVWDLLPGEFAGLWPPAERGDVEVIGVAFLRPDGRAAPSASAKVAKGHLLRVLLDDPTLTPDDLVDGKLLDGWRLRRRDTGIEAIQRP